jgi:hypothetical protein
VRFGGHVPSSIGAVYLRDDSLTCFVSATLDVDMAAITSGCACDSHKHVLAGLRNGLAVVGCDDSEWPRRTCSDVGYLEAIVTGPPSGDDVRTVRISVDLHKAYYDLAFAHIADDLAEDGQLLADVFAEIDEQLSARDITWELVG